MATDSHIPMRSPRLFLLALVTDCMTNGGDGTTDLVSFTSMKSSSRLIDLNAIQNVVGRFQLGNGPSRRWAIIDRSSNWARTVFVDDNDDDRNI
jgi:hypothetical protein